MATFNIPDQDPIVGCPLNSRHKCRFSRLSIHLSKCRKNNPDKEPCPYSASHVVYASELRSHLRTCPERPEPMISTGPVPDDPPPSPPARPVHPNVRQQEPINSADPPRFSVPAGPWTVARPNGPPPSLTSSSVQPGIRQQEPGKSVDLTRSSVPAGLFTVARANGPPPPAPSRSLQSDVLQQDRRENANPLKPSFSALSRPAAREVEVQHGHTGQSSVLRRPAVAMQETCTPKPPPPPPSNSLQPDIHQHDRRESADPPRSSFYAVACQVAREMEVKHGQPGRIPPLRQPAVAMQQARAPEPPPPAPSSFLQSSVRKQDRTESVDPQRPGVSAVQGALATEMEVQRGKPGRIPALRQPAVAMQEACSPEARQSTATPRLQPLIRCIRSPAGGTDVSGKSGDAVFNLARRMAALGRGKAMPERGQEGHL